MDWKWLGEQVLLPFAVAVPTALGMLWWVGLLG